MTPEDAADAAVEADRELRLKHLPSRLQPFQSDERERDLYLEELGWEIMARRQELEVLEARYAQVKAWGRPEVPVGDDDPRPGVDGRCFGRDEADTGWSESEAVVPW